MVSAVLSLNHRVRVYLVKSGSDSGNTVEMRTSVRIEKPVGSVTRVEIANNIAVDTEFLIPPLIFKHEFKSVEIKSVRLAVTENDGSGTANDDGVCYIIVEPVSLPQGTSKYTCRQESANGLQKVWEVQMTIYSFEPIDDLTPP